MDDKTATDTVDSSLFVEAQEQALYDAVTAQQATLKPLLADKDYTQALSSLAAIRPEVDAFFDGVMIMSDDETLKQNRLALLNSLRGLFLHVADLSSLQDA